MENKEFDSIKIGLASPDQIRAWSYGCLLYTLRAHETVLDLVCRLLLEKKKNKHIQNASHIERQ